MDTAGESTVKYKSLAELKAGFDSGEIDRSRYKLSLDNDSSTMYMQTFSEQADAEGWECVYDGEGYNLREEALDLLGIPWDHV